MSKLRNNRGITLVALIITIIVLLILAMVSIRLVMNGGIIDKSKNAVDKYSNEEIMEQIKLAYQEYQMSQYTDNPLTLQQAMDKAFGEGVATVSGDATSGWTVTYKGKDYTLSANGKIDVAKVIDWDTVIANAQKHPEQSPTITDIGIDMYGNPVNLDNWSYELLDDGTNKTIRIGKQIGSKADDVGNGYIGNYTSDGKIEGEIPQYIIKDNEKYTLIDMTKAFYYNQDIKIAPSIPPTVFNMSNTFDSCTSLTTVPVIPNSVINMESTFSGCISLTTVGNISNSVVNMRGTFDNCIVLTTAFTIPNTVTDMFKAFQNCKSLTGKLVINAENLDSEFEYMGTTLKMYSNCLANAATNDGCNLVVSGICPQLDEIIATKSPNSHITKGN